MTTTAQPTGPDNEKYSLRVRGVIPVWSVVVLIYHTLIIVVVGIALYLIHKGTGAFADAVVSRALLVLSSGALGGTMQSSRRVVHSVRHSTYDTKRLPWQIMTPVHSAVLAGIAVGALQAGLITTVSSWSAAEPQYTLFLIVFSFIVGFASESFVKRLYMAADTLLGEKPDERESVEDR